MTHRLARISCALLLAAWAVGVGARDRQIPQVQTSPTADLGARLFKQHCASCHGADGRGTGPETAGLGTPPKDLTKYTDRNGGVFPSAHLHRIIDGRDVNSHGTPEMPVWGRVFLRHDGDTVASVAARIDAIVNFLATIQQRAG
jgi:mono/diheme cytochrome c family protein